MLPSLTVIGVGLIGGSFALTLKEKNIVGHVTGVCRSTLSAAKSIELGLVDEILPLEKAIAHADIIFIAVPVDISIPLVNYILDHVKSNQVVTDAGSTKAPLCDAIKSHPQRHRFVAGHPMWGTEFSGPEAATKDAFQNRTCVLCDTEFSDADAVEQIEKIYQTIGMKTMHMNSTEHDLHAAFLSHLSHITSFVLANTVLTREKNEELLFALAVGGFESTVRLAKSNAAMWTPIIIQNKANILLAIDSHLDQMIQFKNAMIHDDTAELNKLITQANQIKRILK